MRRTGEYDGMILLPAKASGNIQCTGILLVLLFFSLSAWGTQDQIRLNQVGFAQYGPKVAVVIEPETWYFTIRDPGGQTVYQGELSEQLRWTTSAETLKVADFSDFTSKGSYVVHVEGVGSSYPFAIGDESFHELSRALIKAFYYQRCTSALPTVYAGLWSRKAGHPDEEVMVHPSAASDPTKPGARKTGQIFPSPKGWYDAGDYGKYTVNAGISTYELMMLYEAFPEYFSTFSLNIPESGNTIPDILDEIKWELDWLLTMQDPADGGVYHKVTDKSFIGDVMPSDSKEKRYFIGKAAPATFDFAAVCAVAYRLYKPFLPSFADSCLAAAQYAWEWGNLFPDSCFRNPDDVVTGEYGDRNPGDEHLWAGCELFIATGDSSYYKIGIEQSTNFIVPSWPVVAMLGCYSMALHHNDSLARAKILKKADDLVGSIPKNAYRVTMKSNNFYWGSNGVAANQGTTALMAYLLTGEVRYFETAVHAADYFLGRNATGYCFVTGFGTKSPQHPHHRPSTADRVAAPVPGLLAGGPNGDKNGRSGELCDEAYPAQRAKAYLDNTCSYSTNEVAINWNAPAAFLTGGIDAILQSGAFDLSALRTRYTDTLPPAPAGVNVVSAGIDYATVTVTADDTASAVLAVSADQNFTATRIVDVNSWDSAGVMIDGLTPGTIWYVKLLRMDAGGNASVTIDSFMTQESAVAAPALYAKTNATVVPGTPLPFSIAVPAPVAGEVLYAPGGHLGYSALPLSRSGGMLSAAVPAEVCGPDGIRYRVRLFSGADTVTGPEYGIAALDAPHDCDVLSLRNRYRLISVPGVFDPTPADLFFGAAFGDTAAWDYFGVAADGQGYEQSAALRPGSGGWLYHEADNAFSFTADALPPDTMFPVNLQKGWNCLGNPFTFPVFWDNTFVKTGNGLVSITADGATHYLRRQVFWYSDTSADRITNGYYATNRNMQTHAYADSALLEPWSACWVYAEADGVTCLLNPARSVPAAPLAKKRRQVDSLWQCALVVSSGARDGEHLYFGQCAGAKHGYDRCDVPKPPAVGGGLNAFFARTSEMNTTVPLMADLTPKGSGSEECRWDLEIRALPFTSLTLRWEKQNVPQGTMWLIDEETGARGDMRNLQEYTLRPVAAASRTVSIVFGGEGGCTAGTVADQKVRALVTAGKGVRFTCMLPPVSENSGPEQVKFSVYDVQGRVLFRTGALYSGVGEFSYYWNGRTTSGPQLSQGCYLANVVVRGRSYTTLFQMFR